MFRDCVVANWQIFREDKDEKGFKKKATTKPYSSFLWYKDLKNKQTETNKPLLFICLFPKDVRKKSY